MTNKNFPHFSSISLPRRGRNVNVIVTFLQKFHENQFISEIFTKKERWATVNFVQTSII